MALKLPNRLAEKGFNREYAKAINELTEAIKRIQPVAAVGQRLEAGPNGTSVTGGSTGLTAAVDSVPRWR